MKISIETIPHDSQRYETPGDWWWGDSETLHIRVSDTGNWKHAVLVALHELVEVCLCKERGIPEQTVDSFDLRYEAERLNGEHGPEEEPGDDPASPYRKEHFFATNVERLMAAELGVDWTEYDKTIVSLKQHNPQ